MRLLRGESRDAECQETRRVDFKWFPRLDFKHLLAPQNMNFQLLIPCLCWLGGIARCKSLRLTILTLFTYMMCCRCSYSSFVLTVKPARDSSLVAREFPTAANKTEAPLAHDKFCTCRKQVPRYAHDIHLESWISNKSLKAYRTTGIIVYFLCDGGIQLCFNTSINIYVYFLGRGLFYSLTVKFDRELERGGQSFLCRWLCV